MSVPNCSRVFLLLALLTLVFSSPLSAGQWKPLCIEGSSCSAPYNWMLGGGTGGYYPIDRHAAGPLITSQGILLHHSPIASSWSCPTCNKELHIARLSSEGLEDLGGGLGAESNANAVQLPSGKILAFNLYSEYAWFDPDEGVEISNWSGGDALSWNSAALTGPPVYIDGTTYIAIRGGGGTNFYVSTDEGVSWARQNGSNIRVGDDRFNLLTNPEGNALWAIHSEFFEEPGSLWESSDHGVTWIQVDDGSFPPNTVRVQHDPDNELVSYALSSHGLFVSLNRGITWLPTPMTESVHGLVFASSKDSFVRALIVGTDSGVRMSVDQGESWENMSRGLLEQPYTLTYAHGQLIATGNSGYFTCNAMDCFGESQVLQYDGGKGIVEVVEFYNSILDHYFITGVESEAAAIDQGAAGDGWTRTGEKFQAWSLGASDEATTVCRFYGSIMPGPNSHFYSVSPQECRFQMDLQALIPDDRPRWNFEGYAFSILPPNPGALEPCPDTTLSVYRAYNNGYKQGEDSNHRYMTDLKLMDEMVAKGWIDEGVAFCSPTD